MIRMNRKLLKSVLVLGTLFVLILFNRSIPVNKMDEKIMHLTDKRVEPAFLQSPASWIDSIMDTLSLEEKIGQLIMVSAYSNRANRNEKEILKLIRDYKIGGLVFFQGNPFDQALLTNYYQSVSRIPLFIAMDAEAGLGMRLDSTIRYPNQMMLGAIQNDRLIFEMGGQIARQLKRLGVHINFAPVVDINNNPQNPVINSRSFGENLSSVSRKSLFYMIGMENAGIISVAKHFPGHGDTDADSHVELPAIKHNRQRLDSLELFPFRELIYNGLSGIMTAHLFVPSLDSRAYMPSSLSERVVDSLLRKDMGFKGLVFTDALGMKGITSHYKPVEAARLALLAGNDVLLMPEDIPGVVREIALLIRQGNLPEQLVDMKCRKVLAAKYWAGLHHYKPIELAHLTSDLNKPEYVLLQRRLIESSLTVLNNSDHILPVKRLDTLRIASVTLSSKSDSVFQKTLQLYMPVTCFQIRGDGFDNTDSIFRELAKYNLVIASIHASTQNPATQFGITDCSLEILDTLASSREIILDVFASPYLLKRLDHVKHLKALMVSYENTPLVQDISAQAICGAIGVNGTLPVTPSDMHTANSGLSTDQLGRLKFTIPFEANMNEDTLKKIDQIIQKAIQYQAFPGCQILVARKGKIVFNKSYGNPTYNSSMPVNSGNLYDLASITKVAATTPAIMYLVDEGCVGLSQKLSAYLPYLLNTNKKNILISDILLHQSGLQSSMQFYFNTQEAVFKNQTLVSSSLSDDNPLKVSTGQYMNRYTHYRNDIISDEYSAGFPYKMADNLYISRSWPDTMYKGIARTSLNAKKSYVYSDLGFILLKQMVDSITGMPFDRLMDSLFYKRLGADHLCFNPLNHYDRMTIVPTEDDQLFRKQLIRGYVHDQRAAMFGGIAGHAGLFSNAVDLAKLFQMYLNNGVYGGERYLSHETVDLFISGGNGIPGNRRGYGFDKPESDRSKPSPACREASSRSFGHSGFTGTMVWADPAYDLVFVFLSNRVYPDASNNKLVEMNVRTNVQQVVYHSMMDR